MIGQSWNPRPRRSGWRKSPSGSHVELGLALAQGKKVFLCAGDAEAFAPENTVAFYQLPGGGPAGGDGPGEPGENFGVRRAPVSIRYACGRMMGLPRRGCAQR